MPDHSHVLRMPFDDGTTREIELIADQAHALEAGQPLVYFPRDERIRVDGDGRIIACESAVPPLAA